MCQIITIDFQKRVLVDIDTDLGPSFSEKVIQAVNNNIKEGYLGFIFKDMGDKTYLYGDTTFDVKELTALIHFYQSQGYTTKTGKDIDEDEGFIGDYYLDLTWDT